MAFERMEFRKRISYPEPGTEDFRKGMQISLEAYDAALEFLIEAMKQIRESFRDMIRNHIGMEEYEEYLKDNRAAEKAKEMRPDAAERELIFEEDHEKQEEDRAKHKDLGQQGKAEDLKELQTALQNSAHRVKKDLEDIHGKQMEDGYDPDIMPKPESILRQDEEKEKRRNR